MLAYFKMNSKTQFWFWMHTLQSLISETISHIFLAWGNRAVRFDTGSCGRPTYGDTESEERKNGLFKTSLWPLHSPSTWEVLEWELLLMGGWKRQKMLKTKIKGNDQFLGSSVSWAMKRSKHCLGAHLQTLSKYWKEGKQEEKKYKRERGNEKW